MRFSVLVPVYQAEAYLEHCIQSVLDQTFSDFELILVDDGSKDQSGKICDAYAKTDARVRAFHKENGGQLSARTYALNHAKGEITVFLDADDALKSNALEVIERSFRKYDCDCVFFGLERVENGVVISSQKDPETVVLRDKRAIYRKFLLSSRYNSLCQKAIRTELIPKKEYPDLHKVRHGEDLLQSLDVYRNMNSVVFLPDALYLYTKNPSSVSSSDSYVGFSEDLFIVQSRVLAFLRSVTEITPEDVEDYRIFCQNQFARLLLMIANAKDPYAAKKRLFEKLRADPYYQDFLRNAPVQGGNKGRIIKHYRGRRYRRLIWETRLYRTLVLRKS